MAIKNQPLDTLCRRALRKGAPPALAWLAAHPDACDLEAVRDIVTTLTDAGADAVHVDEAEADPPRCRTLIVVLPAVRRHVDAVVQAATRLERRLHLPDPGAQRGNHFLIVRCVATA